MSHCVYVRNVDVKGSWQDLKDHMRINDSTECFCDLLKNDSGRSKGCAFVGYSSEGDRQKAVKVKNNTRFRNRQIYVSIANGKKE